jgi:hypothetical protein
VKARRIKAEIRVRLRVPAQIHSDDAVAAFTAWFRRTYRTRQKPLHVILEKPFIASALHANAGGITWTVSEGGEGTQFVSQIKKDFETRWKRAQKDRRRAQWLDKVGKFILRNWRVIRDWPELAENGCPGLREWSPRAAAALIRTLPYATNAGGEAGYIKKRNRLGLTGKRRYRVTDFRAYKDGRREIEID